MLERSTPITDGELPESVVAGGEAMVESIAPVPETNDIAGPIDIDAAALAVDSLSLAASEATSVEPDAVSLPDETAFNTSLVTAAKAGDTTARAELMAIAQPLITRYCRARLDRASSDDVAQEVALAVLKALPEYRKIAGKAFEAFIYGIARHKVADVYRASGRNRSDLVAEFPDEVSAHTASPEEHLLRLETGTDLGRLLLKHLTSEQRKVLLLRAVVGMSSEETALAVGSTPGAVRVTQHRAVKRLREVAGASR